MKTPEGLETLVDYGIVQEVLRPLMSGKEAQIYVVVADGEEYVAKVYKEANQRTFKHRSEYTEGRRTRNSRDQRAVSKRTRHGRKQDEAAWRSTEVEMIYRLRDAGVRVPEPINFVDGVLVMELVKDAQGNPAPRLGDLSFGADEAYQIYLGLIREVVRMLCAGVVHGDLSDFNVLMSADGPVVIDFPQSVDPAQNPNARKLLLRDVENLHRFLERCAPKRRTPAYAQEMWALYEANRLTPDTELAGDYRAPQGKANTAEVLSLIDDADSEEQARREARGVETPVKGPKPLREVVDFAKERADEQRAARAKRARNRPARKPQQAKAPATEGPAAPKNRRSRRRRKARSEASGEARARAPRSDTSPARADVDATTGRPAESNPPKARRRGRRSGGRSRSGGAATAASSSPQPGAGPASAASSNTKRTARPASATRSNAKRPARPASATRSNAKRPTGPASATTSKAKRPARPAPRAGTDARRPTRSIQPPADSRSSTGTATAAAGTDRPARRRRRRPRASRTRETT